MAPWVLIAALLALALLVLYASLALAEPEAIRRRPRDRRG